MITYWNTKFTKRDYECTTIVAIVAEKLPKGYDPTIWRADGMSVGEKYPSGIGPQFLGAIHQNGERFEQYGYL